MTYFTISIIVDWLNFSENIALIILIIIKLFIITIQVYQVILLILTFYSIPPYG